MSSPLNMPVYAAPVSDAEFKPMPALLRLNAETHPDKTAVIDGERKLSWQELQQLVNRIANRLIKEGLQPGQTVAGLSENSAEYVALYLGVITAGGCMVPLSGMAAGDTLGLMIDDCDANFLFVSARNRELVEPLYDRLAKIPTGNRVGLDFGNAHWATLDAWLADAPDTAPVVEITPDHPFNIIYSSGTTGVPKGILHDHRMRSLQLARMRKGYGLGENAITLVSTPLYSNTTLVSALPTLAYGGTVVLMAKFEPREFLALSERHKVSHAMLVPVQYERILRVADFDSFDLSSYRAKLSTSAPLRGRVIREILDRWPGKIYEIYGLTEGGVSTILDAAAHPNKLDSVGKPAGGVELRIIDEAGKELPIGEIGEIVGRAGAMMRGYYKRDAQTKELLWQSPEGHWFYRTGDMGRLDEDGFLYVLDRRKDMIISGGFNIYAADLEAVLLKHPDVVDVAVIGVPSEQWGETPLGLVVRRDNGQVSEAELLEWANAQLGKAQRLSTLEFRDELPRSTIGKVLKRELRAPYWEGVK